MARKMTKGQVAIGLNGEPFNARNLRGQVATEFLIYAGVFLVLVIVVAASLNFTQSTEISVLEYSLAKENGQSFADAIHTALKGGHGFTYSFYFPQKVLGRPYFVDFGEGGGVSMTWLGPAGNFTYAYGTEPFDAQYNICSAGNKKLKSDLGNNLLTISNDGVLLTITQTC